MQMAETTKLDAYYCNSNQKKPMAHSVVGLEDLEIEKTGKKAQRVPRRGIERVTNPSIPRRKLVYREHWLQGPWEAVEDVVIPPEIWYGDACNSWNSSWIPCITQDLNINPPMLSPDR